MADVMVPVAPVAPDYKAMPFPALVGVIRKDWKKVYFGAVPYLSAMGAMNDVTDAYGADSGPSVVRYFLANASTWRGPVAKGVKAALNARLKGKW